MQVQQQQQQNNIMVYDAPHRDIFEGHSIKIVLPPKPGYEDTYNINGPKAKMDVCALTLSCLAQDPNLPSSKLPFAWKLYEMLETVHRNGIDTDIVSWVDDGKAFKVHDLQRFVEEIVPTYFKQSKYKSFQRQLYFYGFTRVTSSVKRKQTAGSYRHPKFLRGKKTLCLSMVPKKNKKRSSKSLGVANVVDNKKEPQQTQNIIPSPPVTKTRNLPRIVSVEVEEGSAAITNDITPIPLLRVPPITASFQAENDTRAAGIIHDAYHHQHCDDRITNMSYVHQQNQLQRLQREQFYRYLNHQEPQQQQQQQQPQLQRQRIVQFCNQEQEQWPRVDEEACCIFGGKTFHSVSKKSRN